ncbi:MAG: replicative DNA helicase, partial [candidate division NC10 bacterium]
MTVATLTDLLSSKIPPQNLEAERAILGAILLENESLPRTIEILTPADFYKEGHRKIFATMIALFERTEPVDLLTLSEELRRRGGLDEVGGPAALAALVEEAATAAHLLSYATIVREKALLRELIRISTEIIGQSYEAQEEVDSLLDQAERMIFQVSERRILNSAIPVRSILKETFEYIETLYERKEHVTGLPTGFSQLDRMTSGLQPSDFIIVAGRPSMGKTAFALNVAQHVGCEPHKKRVLIFSLEMSKEQLVQRLLCSEARVDSHRVRTGYLEPKDWPRLTNAAGRLADSSIFIDDTAALSGLEARAKARRMKAEHGLDLIVIDYLQLMRGRSAAENR